MKTSAVILGSSLVAILGAIAFARSARATRDVSGVWSCNIAARHSCAQWERASDQASLADQQDGCVHMGGLVEDRGCPTVDVIGTCRAAANRVVYYAGRDLARARSVCSMVGGNWY